MQSKKKIFLIWGLLTITAMILIGCSPVDTGLNNLNEQQAINQAIDTFIQAHIESDINKLKSVISTVALYHDTTIDKYAAELAEADFWGSSNLEVNIRIIDINDNNAVVLGDFDGVYKNGFPLPENGVIEIHLYKENDTWYITYYEHEKYTTDEYTAAENQFNEYLVAILNQDIEKLKATTMIESDFETYFEISNSFLENLEYTNEAEYITKLREELMSLSGVTSLDSIEALDIISGELTYVDNNDNIIAEGIYVKGNLYINGQIVEKTAGPVRIELKLFNNNGNWEANEIVFNNFY